MKPTPTPAPPLAPAANKAHAPAAIRTEGLRKIYPRAQGDLVAVDGLDLTVHQGEFFGLLGTNGAGKSTTIGMLTTLVAPSAGKAWVAEREVSADPVGVRSRIGVVSQANTLDRALTVADNLAFRGRYFGMPAPAARRRALELLEQFGLADKAGAKAHQLSGGQTRRVMIGRALMHLPEVLFLDEPSAGVDPQARDDLWQIIASLHETGQTVVLTTHYLDEAEALCQRLAVIDHGHLLACDTPEAIKASSGAQTVITVHYDADATPAADALHSIPGGPHDVAVDGPTVRVRTAHPDGVLGHLLRIGSAAGLTVRDATTTPPSLQTAFLTLTGRDYTP
ncbi:ABC transporter ATP-binding protein [Streptomyces malaysiensis]|uniref:ABC transporter ATP-binding protein n=1 Tax=Streptomyces malaysiensis TaxID=92644 RepID=UPI0024C0B633|nr:ATP-binding cassette domain-containing protein [Streptomyces sp. NA07423]WHX15593.1 ATP-binding cassette domain-containing protein [Streptomyces sp. NA07423]